jgi:hypothetical protein
MSCITLEARQYLDKGVQEDIPRYEKGSEFRIAS